MPKLKCPEELKLEVVQYVMNAKGITGILPDKMI